MESKLKQLIMSVPELVETAKICREVKLPNYYIAGGTVTQLIWNHLLGLNPLDKVKDFDIVYFDNVENITQSDYEILIESKVSHGVKIDIKNQANVHKWYPIKFGQTISAYEKSQQGIDSWLSAFAIGFNFNFNESDGISIYAPYGLEDAFNMMVKPNKRVMSKDNYLKMTKSFKKRWPAIKVEDWN